MGRESNRQIYVYCVVKSAVIRKKDGTIVCSIPFGNPFKVLARVEDGLYYGEAYKKDGRGNTKYRGFVNVNGFTRHKIVDMSYLRYRNRTGQRIPVTMRYRGEATGWIEPDEIVQVLSLVNGWMLTEKGWTKADWLQKIRDICDYDCVKDLVYAVITQTVKDYTGIIRCLQSGYRYYTKDLTDCIAEMRLIRQFFMEGNYLKIIDDQYTGEERLNQIDKDLGVTDEWVKQMLSRKRKSRL